MGFYISDYILSWSVGSFFPHGSYRDSGSFYLVGLPAPKPCEIFASSWWKVDNTLEKTHSLLKNLTQK